MIDILLISSSKLRTPHIRARLEASGAVYQLVVPCMARHGNCARMLKRSEAPIC